MFIFVVETRVWLKPGQKTFGGYVFNLPWREEKSYSVLLQEPEFLGCDYVVLTPEDIDGCVPWESIPLVLIKGLMNGELQPAGTTILSASENGRIYRIKDFKGEVTIPRSFENYLQKIGNIEQMVSIGIVDQEVAKGAGLPYLGLHDLRHIHATMLLKTGTHPRIVQERLGHSSIATTLNIYSHTVPSMQKAAAERIDTLLPKTEEIENVGKRG